jgi:biopolymer transport protein ExbB
VIVSLSVSFERAVFWARQNGPAGKRGFAAMMDAMRRGDATRANALADTSETVYARVARALLRDGATDAVGVGSVETERIRIDRFMATLSTIITAAPMLGILGTVTGIITSFDLLSGGEAMVDPRAVSGGISEALVATASGLVVALLALFPYMAFGAMRENTSPASFTRKNAAMPAGRPMTKAIARGGHAGFPRHPGRHASRSARCVLESPERRRSAP